jgi:hypothetical protein
MTRLTLEIQDLSRRSPLTSIDVPDLNSSTTEEVALMSRSINRRAVIGVWFAVLVAVAGAGALSGVSITTGISALWFVACVVPPAVVLMVWRGTPPPTVAEILHAVDRRD